MRDIPKDTHFCYLGGLSDADGATSSHVLLDVIHSNPRIEMVKKYTSQNVNNLSENMLLDDLC